MTSGVMMLDVALEISSISTWTGRSLMARARTRLTISVDLHQLVLHRT